MSSVPECIIPNYYLQIQNEQDFLFVSSLLPLPPPSSLLLLMKTTKRDAFSSHPFLTKAEWQQIF